MGKKIFAIAVACCALVLGLAACAGGSSTAPAAGTSAAGTSPTETSAEAAARAEAEAQAAAEAEAKAALDEGLGYWFGTGADGYDKEKARAAFQQAADGGNAEGWYWLGAVMATDTNADRWPKAMEYYQAAADENYAGGWMGLASLYKGGIGVEADAVKATEYYANEAKCGAAYNLGVRYEFGYGCEQDHVKAIELFNQEIASGKKAAWAMGGLAYMATQGWGMDQDYAVAAEWIRKSLDAAGPKDSGAVNYANEWLDDIANGA